MKVKMFCLCFVLVFIAFATAQDSLQVEPTKMQQADALHQKLDNDGALALYKEIVEMDSLNYEANWKAARVP